jgi:uncharacterized protein
MSQKPFSFSRFFKPWGITSTGPLDLLILQPTPFCNLACDYCYLPDKSSTKKMPMQVIEAALKRAFDSGLIHEKFTVVWHSGEPLAAGLSFYKEAFALIERMRPKHIKIEHSLQTNGTIISDEWCELFKEYQVKVGVSVDGPEFLHDRHRKTKSGHGTHAKVMRGIQLLQKHGLDVHTISVLTREALEYPDEMFEFFLNSDIRSAGFNIEEKEGVNTNSSLEEGATEEKYKNFMSRIYDLNKGTENRLRIRELHTAKESIRYWNPAGGKMSQIVGLQENSPFKIISVDHDGFFSTFSPELLGMPTEKYGKFTLGNVLLDSFEDAARSAKFRDIARDIKAGIRNCEKTCAYFAVCGGGSPANKLYENGSFESTETFYCRMQKKANIDMVLDKLESELQVQSTEKAAVGA